MQLQQPVQWQSCPAADTPCHTVADSQSRAVFALTALPKPRLKHHTAFTAACFAARRGIVRLCCMHERGRSCLSPQHQHVYGTATQLVIGQRSATAGGLLSILATAQPLGANSVIADA